MPTNQEILDAVNTTLAGGKPKRVEFGDKEIEQYSIKELMDVKKQLETDIQSTAREGSGMHFGKAKFMGRNS